MKKIRQKAFETNSSSVHAFVKLGKKYDIKQYTPQTGDFGWQWEDYRGEGFIDYLLTLFINCKERELAEELLEICNSGMSYDDYLSGYSGYVDHEDAKIGVIKEMMGKYTLEEIIAGFYVETGNDNDWDIDKLLSKADYSAAQHF